MTQHKGPHPGLSRLGGTSEGTGWTSRTQGTTQATRGLGGVTRGLLSIGLTTAAAIAGCRAPQSENMGSRLQRVIGGDERIELRNAAYPFGSVLLVQIMTGDAAGTWLPCTATLVSHDTIVTAAHCVKSLRRRDGDKSRTSVVIRAADGAGGFRSETARVASWVPVTKFADVAVGVLDKPWGEDLGWMTVSSAAPATPEIVSSIGFPSDRFDPVAGVFAPSLQEGCAIRTYDPTGVRLPDGDIGYDCDTSGGSSGGALFRYERSKGRAVLRGVVTGGYKVDPADSYLEYPNFGYSGVTFATMASRVSRIARAYRDLREVAPGYAALDRYLGVIDTEAQLAERITDLVAMGERALDESGKFPSTKELVDALFPASPSPTPSPVPLASPQPTVEPTVVATPVATPDEPLVATPSSTPEPTPAPTPPATEPTPAPTPPATEPTPAPTPPATEPTPAPMPAAVPTPEPQPSEPQPAASSTPAPETSPTSAPTVTTGGNPVEESTGESASDPTTTRPPQPIVINDTDAPLPQQDTGFAPTPTPAPVSMSPPETVRPVETPLPSLDPTPEPDASAWP